MGSHPTEELLHSKRNIHYTQETAHRMGENLSDRGLISRIYRVLKKLNP
jgi:hypothetical protein